MSCTFTQASFSDNLDGTFSGTLTVDSTDYPATLTVSDPVITNWTLVVNSSTYNADAASTSAPMNVIFYSVSFPCGLMTVQLNTGTCGSSGPSDACTTCPDLPTTLYITCGGFIPGSCTDCANFNGVFTCVQTDTDCDWNAVDAVTACSGATWTWQIIRYATYWEVALENGSGGIWAWLTESTSCVLPLTLPLYAAGTNMVNCTQAPTVVISE